QNLGGPVGHLLADTILRALGVAAYLFPVYLGVVAVALLRGTGDDLGAARLGGAVLLVGGVAAAAGLVAGGKATRRGGGWVGGFLGAGRRGLGGGAGGPLGMAGGLVVALVPATGISAFDMAAYIGRWTFGLVRTGGTWVTALFRRSPVPAAEEPVRAARMPRAPIRLVDPLVDPIGATPGTPEPVEKRDAPPPLIREP